MNKLKDKYDENDESTQSNWYNSDFANLFGFGFIFFSIFAGIALVCYICK